MAVRSEAASGAGIRIDVVKAKLADIRSVAEGRQVQPREVTHDHIAEHLGVSVRTVGRWAAGSGVLLETASDVAQKLGISVEVLSGREPA